MIRLLVKTFSNGKKYLCKREDGDFLKYKGSGKNITDDLVLVDTEVLLETEDKEEFKKVGIYYSKLFDVVNSDDWLNMKMEEGDGGDTKSGTRAYNNGSRTAFFVEGHQPEGWELGRHDKHNFSSESQKRKSSLSTWHGSDAQKEVARKMGVANSKPCFVEGVRHPSIAEAMRKTGYCKAKIYRIKE